MTSTFMSPFPAQKMLIKINFSTHLRNKDEMHKEADPADCKNKELAPHGSTEPPWKQINGRGDEALHCHKLKKKIKCNFGN